jgi:hypothetical protein
MYCFVPQMFRQEGKKVRILSQLREIGLPAGDANRMLFLKQWLT